MICAADQQRKGALLIARCLEFIEFSLHFFHSIFVVPKASERKVDLYVFEWNSNLFLNSRVVINKKFRMGSL